MTAESNIATVLQEMHGSSLHPESRVAYFRAKYPVFAESHPRLFECAMNPDFPLFDGDFLRNMLMMKDSLDSDKISVDCADQDIYDRLRTKYIDPVITGLEAKALSDAPLLEPDATEHA